MMGARELAPDPRYRSFAQVYQLEEAEVKREDVYRIAYAQC